MKILGFTNECNKKQNFSADEIYRGKLSVKFSEFKMRRDEYHL